MADVAGGQADDALVPLTPVVPNCPPSRLAVGDSARDVASRALWGTL